MKKLILFTLIFFISSSTALALGSTFQDNRWSFGIIGGYGHGFGNCEGDCDIPNLSNDHYQFVNFMVAGAYRFSELHSTRIAIGLDHYLKNSPFDNSKHIFLAGEGSYIYHFTNDRNLFSPYFTAGFRFPHANIGLGIGNEFAFADTFSIIAEITINTFFTLDQKVEGRIGFMAHF